MEVSVWGEDEGAGVADTSFQLGLIKIAEVHLNGDYIY